MSSLPERLLDVAVCCSAVNPVNFHEVLNDFLALFELVDSKANMVSHVAKVAKQLESCKLLSARPGKVPNFVTLQWAGGAATLALRCSHDGVAHLDSLDCDPLLFKNCTTHV